MHLAAAIPNFLITEYFVNFEALGREIADAPLIAEGGYITLPTRRGWASTSTKRRSPAMRTSQFPPRAIRQPADEGP